LRKFTIVAMMVAMTLAVTIPAMASDGGDAEANGGDAASLQSNEALQALEQRQEQRQEKDHDKKYYDKKYYDKKYYDKKDHDKKDHDKKDHDKKDHDKKDRDFDRFGAVEVTQESEQETESGDVDQSFVVTNEGDNSNQCANVQGVAQTGNSQNQIDLLPVFSVADDYEFDEVGSTIDESPTNTATCDQQVNQAASASYGW
jgi:hypothetical protein